jgi:hypothetical protein
MIIKNHTIELKDTSASEMARFRQTMLGIWRQQNEDEKNEGEMLQYLKEKHQTAKSLDAKYAETLQKPEEINLQGDRYILDNDNHYQYTYASALDEVVIAGYISPLTSILNWIKKNIGNKAKELKLSSFPKDTPINFTGTFKGYTISCNRQLLETIIDLKNIEFNVSFPVKTFFLLDIFDLQKNLTLRFETDSYEGMEYLAKFIGYDIDVFKTTITQQYKKEITAAGNDKDKLDIVYEVIPDFILASLKTDQQMYADIWRLLDQNLSDKFGRDENKGILNILKTLQKKDAKKLYDKLYDRSLWVMRIYEKFSGEDRKNFVSLLMTLSREFNHKELNKKSYAVIPDGYWFKQHILNVSWTSDRQIEIKGYGQEATNIERIIANVLSTPGPTSEANAALKIRPRIGTDQYVQEVITPALTSPVFKVNPMDLVPIRSIAVISKEQTLVEETKQSALFLKYTEDELRDKVFWDVVNIATTLAGGSGAVRVLILEGTGWLLKTAAILELSKTVLDLVMLSDRAKKALNNAGLGVLVENWATISITTDLAFLSFNGLISLAKYGRKGAKILKDINETEHAAHLEKQTEKTFTEIEKKTGVDVSEMTEKEIESLVKQTMINNRKTITLADVSQLGTANKVELIDQTGEKVAYITRNMRYGAKKGITYELNALKEAGTIKKGSKIDLNCEMKLLDSESAKKYDLTVKQNEEILYLDFNIPAKINEQYSGLGQIIFDDAHTFMKNSKKVPEINGMFGMWIKYPAYYAHYGGESINLKKFLKAVDAGMDEKKAAFETITGGWAKENGYTKVEFQGEWSRKEVIVKFLKE